MAAASKPWWKSVEGQSCPVLGVWEAGQGTVQRGSQGLYCSTQGHSARVSPRHTQNCAPLVAGGSKAKRVGTDKHNLKVLYFVCFFAFHFSVVVWFGLFCLRQGLVL